MFGFLIDDEENSLIDRAIKGDDGAFTLLMQKHEGRMYSLSLRMCSNPDDAMDCVQNAMLRIYKSLSSFKRQSAFSTWIYRITMNSCLDELRRKKSRSAVSLDVLLETGWAPADKSSPERETEQKEKRRVIDSAISELPDDMRAAIVLREVQGFRYEEIAEMLGTNIGTVKSRISRGRERLRAALLKNKDLFDELNGKY